MVDAWRGWATDDVGGSTGRAKKVDRRELRCPLLMMALHVGLRDMCNDRPREVVNCLEHIGFGQLASGTGGCLHFSMMKRIVLFLREYAGGRFWRNRAVS